jgi:3D-(3,5/4)-trihydroxycyclohexane-1,2-dione acylhydrolase (decyclizing)
MDGLMEAMKVLTSPSLTGAATICLPQDVQVEAYDYPLDFFEERVWDIPRNRPDSHLIAKAVDWINQAINPLIIAGGGVKYSQAENELVQFIEKYSIPVCETFAGKGTVYYDHLLHLGAIGVTGTIPANKVASKADLVIGIGTRLSDFTTSSNSLFQNENVKFIFINVNEIDSKIYPGIPLIGDAQSTIIELLNSVNSVDRSEYLNEIYQEKSKWQSLKNAYIEKQQKSLTQIGLLSTLNKSVKPTDIVINASGSMPGELNQLWDAASSDHLYLEYGYSCMGHEIPAGIGAKLAHNDSIVYVLIGDGGYLMLPSEIVTAGQLNLHLCIIMMDNQGYGSIGQLSKKVGADGLGTSFSDPKNPTPFKIDFIKNAESLGATTHDIKSYKDFESALKQVKLISTVHFLYCKVPYSQTIPNGAWWDVPVAEVSKSAQAIRIKEDYDRMKAYQKRHL